ncbi:HAD-IIA family hydrolase [Actinomycetospora cinnamomea]|uniref:HAD superfamily hydrolase (TIGR01450 family) n=1 Tax=Actinomycetospora cinnamomea TaxID=663609 RepID=A0A2U1EAF2_9PSEU|nr:HAD-IIA family hydrolase [Actinomycetospora cinnamomea]PVY96877.1 HAD superfamily hydrolase (TIGR01450 family) [Actinomycetospora cinnamomea]
MSGYDALLVDLDGTVYKGPSAIEGAVESLEAARESATVSFVTNNASRGPDEVAGHLRELGLTLDTGDVVTSAQAGAAVLAQQCEAGARVLVVGTEALCEEIRLVGLEPVRADEDGPVAVVQGHDPETGWAILAEATLALHRGAVWVACNIDPTLPHARGLLPGNGSFVAALRTATGREPQVAGKPAAPLLQQAIERAGARRPLIVGDRLDTDIAGAHAVEADSLLVLTGVSTPADVLVAVPEQRPVFLGHDLSVLGDGLEATRVWDGDAAGWHARRDGRVLVLRAGDGAGDAAAALRALCRVAWDEPDGAGGRAEVRGADDRAREMISTLGLDAG